MDEGISALKATQMWDMVPKQSEAHFIQMGIQVKNSHEWIN